jgi:hypothetical protein
MVTGAGDTAGYLFKVEVLASGVTGILKVYLADPSRMQVTVATYTSLDITTSSGFARDGFEMLKRLSIVVPPLGARIKLYGITSVPNLLK